MRLKARFNRNKIAERMFFSATRIWDKRTMLKTDDGVWEPLMFVAALAVATWIGYLLYGDRILPQEQTAARPVPRVEATVANRETQTPPSDRIIPSL
jgi:hypothetical protein